jgi:aspartate/methionine/tyrosine aminotransferase
VERTIAETGPLDGLVIASPSNPTGTLLHAADLEAIGRMCADHSIRLIADEIYHGLTFDEPAATILATHPDTVVLNSFSKYFGMTGWRLGWIVAPDDLLAPMERFQQNLYICAPHVSQVAGIAAFECHDELGPRVDEFRRKREILVHGLQRAGLTELAPSDGAFYVYADVSSLTDDSFALCREWLRTVGVAATPGIDFDPVRGNRFVRFSYAGSERDVTTAVERLGAWLADRRISR